MEYAVIVAGGSGTRLWPLSRQGQPKQLLPLLGGQSLLQLAYERAITVIDPSRVLICAGQAYMDVVAAQLPQVPADNLLGEPEGRDSLAAIVWSTAVARQRDPDAVVAVLTADQVIEPVATFTDALRAALTVAARDHEALVTFGITPTRPHTGFGYVQVGDPVPGVAGAYRVRQFAEKPDATRAAQYVASGDWLWNAGMFCFRAATLLDQVERLRPDMAAGVKRLIANPGALAEIYPTLPKTSIDYAIMEPVSVGSGGAHVDTVTLTATWADVGSYPALAEQLPTIDGNTVEGRVVTLSSTGNLIWNRADDDHLIAVVGLTDTVVVEAGNVTLVCPLGAAEQIKALVDLASREGARYA